MTGERHKHFGGRVRPSLQEVTFSTDPASDFAQSHSLSCWLLLPEAHSRPPGKKSCDWKFTRRSRAFKQLWAQKQFFWKLSHTRKKVINSESTLWLWKLFSSLIFPTKVFHPTSALFPKNQLPVRITHFPWNSDKKENHNLNLQFWGNFHSWMFSRGQGRVYRQCQRGEVYATCLLVSQTSTATLKFFFLFYFLSEATQHLRNLENKKFCKEAVWGLSIMMWVPGGMQLERHLRAKQ